MMARLFIGIPVKSEAIEQKVKLLQKDRLLQRNLLKWVMPENWHVTLLFLGNQDRNAIPLLKQLIEDPYRSVTPFNALINGVGVFHRQRNPNVFWLGLENMQFLTAATYQLAELLQKNGLTFDNKPLLPHLTLARIKTLESKVSFESFLTQHQQYSFGSVEINRVVLYESILHFNGPVYKPLFVKSLCSGKDEIT